MPKNNLCLGTLECIKLCKCPVRIEIIHFNLRLQISWFENFFLFSLILKFVEPLLQPVHMEWMWSRALDVRLREWCCSVSMVWVQIPSREEQKFDSSKI